jgi:hypothetical protein
MTDDRATLNAAFARHVAAKLGPAAAYEPAAQCPQGHLNVYVDGYVDGDDMGPACAIGDLCQVCRSMYWWPEGSAPLEDRLREILDHVDDPHWHPEWRIPPGEPKDFCGSLDLTVLALAYLNLSCSVQTRPGFPVVDITVVSRTDPTRVGQVTIPESVQPGLWATALVRAALRVLGEVTPDARDTGPAATRARD